MKKSLVITTIATVLVIVVALTTATFAWFSSSSSNTVSSNFSAQTSNAVFTFYPWSSGSSDYEFSNGSTSIDFSQYTSIDDVAGKGGLFTVSEMKAYVPLKQIVADASEVLTGNWAGLPGAQFYTAQQSPTDKTNLSNAAKTPKSYGDSENGASLSNAGMVNVARFMLSNGKDENKNVDINITIQGTGNSPDIAVAEALRVFIIGKPSGDNTGAKPFIVGTEYAYDGVPTGVETTWSATFTAENYTTANTASYSTFTTTGGGYANLIAPGSMNRDPAGKIEYKFPYKIADSNFSGISIVSGEYYEVFLYVWLDGSKITDGGSGGAVSFSINFLDSSAAGGSEEVTGG